MNISFLWDARKAAANLRKHGVSFDEATEIFLDPQSISFTDEAHSSNEDRLVSIGRSKTLRILLVVHTEASTVDEGVIIRIISARKPTKIERSVYE